MAPVPHVQGSPLKVFVTGATGYIGSRVVKALLADGHKVSALSRRTGTELEKLDVQIVHAGLTDLDAIAAAAAKADAVMHLAFDHDFTRFQASVDENLAAIKAINEALAGTGKLFVTTSVTALIDDTGDSIAKGIQQVHGPRAPAEDATLAGKEKGVRTAVMRLPMYVYGKNFSFFYDVRYKAAEKKGAASYVGEGDNKFGVVHVDDAVRAYVALLSHSEASGVYNVVGENGVTSKDIAEIIASRVGCKTESITNDEAQQIFSPFVARITSKNNQTDSSMTQRDLDWQPQYTNIKEAI